MDRQRELQKIADEIAQCPLCRKGSAGKAVPGEGRADARIMFVGEMPGQEEAKTGRPFIGRSGKFLRTAIRDIGFDDAGVFITSPVHYLSISGKIFPGMIEHGRAHLLKQIQVIKPRLIVLLGNTACRALLEKNVEIAKEHGKTVEKDGICCLITFHPAYAVRFPEGRKKFLRDFEKVRRLSAVFKNVP